MAISTYAELKTAIADFLNRDDLTSVIPSFIALAEQQMARDIRHWRQEKRIETTLNERYENLPSDFIEALELSTDNNRRLTLISTAEMQDRKEATSTSGAPQYYRFTANQIEFFPAPTATSTSTLSMQYYARIPALSDSNTSNWVLSYAADAYLYGALLHSAPYLQEDQRSVVWAGLYQSAIDGLRRDNDGGKYGGPLKMGVPR
jgi:hypothetical protein